MAVCVVAEVAAMVVGLPAVPEAVNVMVARPKPVAVTVLLLVPTAVPSVQLASVAMPDPLVLTPAGLVGTIVPPPCVSVNVTAKVETAFPLMSVTLTEGGVTAAPTAAVWLVDDCAVMSAAVPTVPDAVKMTGLPVRVPDDACRVLLLVPAVVRSVQLATVAMPFTSVTMVAGAPTAPSPPSTMVNVTGTPWTGLALPSATLTEGRVVTAVPAVVLWVVTELAAMLVAPPAVPVPVKSTGLPVRVPAVALTVLVPALGPSVQLPAVAMPAGLVATVAGAAGTTAPPPPEVTAKLTAKLLIGLPN